MTNWNARLNSLQAAAPPPKSTSERPRVPDIVEFVSSSKYLGHLKLYPRQLTLLKLVFLAEEDALTPYDFDVIEEWGRGFVIPEDYTGQLRFVGSHGTTPDVFDRVRIARAQRRRWMREVVAIVGRRGSKGFLGAIAIAYIVFWYLTQPDDALRVHDLKRLCFFVFAGQRDQAIANQWADIVGLIRSAPCFQPYLAGDPTVDRLLLFSHDQLAHRAQLVPQDARIEITARQATPTAGRGQASPALVFDEMGHMNASGANRSASEVYDAATPSLATFTGFEFLYEASSPWQQTGKFYENAQAALELDPRTRTAVNPDMLVVQLASEELYRDWQLTTNGDFEMSPGGPCFVPLDGPLVEDSFLERERRRDPDMYKTEYGAQWRSALDAYLPEDAVEAMFGSYNGKVLEPQTAGTLARRYAAHADPARVSDRFGFAIGHLEIDALGLPHVVLDMTKCWDPAEAPEGCLNYLDIEHELVGFLVRFPNMKAFTFDQAQSGHFVDGLRDHVRRHGGGFQTAVDVLPATAEYNREAFELFKRMLLQGLIHAPPNELAHQELRFLREVNGRVDHQSNGPVTSKDLVDAMVGVVWHLARTFTNVFDDLASTELHATAPSGLPQPGPSREQAIFDQLSQGVRGYRTLPKIVHREPPSPPLGLRRRAQRRR